MDDTQRSPRSFITHYEGLLTAAGTPEEKAKIASKLLPAVYDPTTTREQLQKIIYSIAEDHNLNLSSSEVNNILASANEALEHTKSEQAPQDALESQRHTSHHRGDSGTVGSLIDHDKYEKDIMDNLHEQQKSEAIKEFDTIRNNADLSKEAQQKTLEDKFQALLDRNSTKEKSIQEQHELLARALEGRGGETTAELQKESAEETQSETETPQLTPAQRLAQNKPLTDTRPDFAKTMQEIAAKAEQQAQDTTPQQKTLDQMIDERVAAAVAKKSAEEQVNLTPEVPTETTHKTSSPLSKESKNQAASRIRRRAVELTQERAADKQARLQELDALEKNAGITAIKHKLQKGQKLSRREQEMFRHYKDLRTLVHRDKRDDKREKRNFDQSIWMERFKKCKSAREQNELIRRYLQIQHSRTQDDVWKIFNTGEKGRFSGLWKKTLTRKERRNLLLTQRQEIQSLRQRQIAPKIKRINFNQLFGMDLNALMQSALMEQSSQEQDTQAPEWPSLSLPNPMNTFNKARDVFNTIKNFRNIFGGGGVGAGGAGAAGGAAAGAGGAAAGAPVGIIVLIVLIILLLIILLVIFIVSLSQSPSSFSQQLIELQCGDMQDIPAIDNVAQMEKVFGKRFGNNNYKILDPRGTQDNVADENIAVKQEERLYSVVCVLFGHIKGNVYQDPTKPSNFNTFGNLVVGTPEQRAKYPESYLAVFTLNIAPDTSDPKDCSIEYMKKMGNDHQPEYIWNFHHPETCSDAKFQFVVAQWLGHALILQQQQLARFGTQTNDVYKLFNTSPAPKGIIGQDGVLPTFDCKNSTNYSENASDQQNRDCFADMVGSYLTYPIYNDLTATSSASQQNKVSTSSATFITFPTSYPDYFLFAKQHLFDNMEFWSNSLSGNSISCPLNDPADSPSMIKTLTAYFNITLTGSVTNSKLVTDMYHTVCKLAKYKYIQLLGVPKTPISVNLIDDNACKGHTQAVTNGYSVDELHSCKSSAGNAFILTHELGHIIQWLNPDLEDQFCTDVYGGKLVKFGSGHVCQSAGHPFNTIPTYNCLYDYINKYKPPYEEECFSDMVGEFLNYTEFIDSANGLPADSYKMGDYPNTFPTYYNFAATNIFTPVAQGDGGIVGLVDTAQALTNHLIKTFGRTIDMYDQLDTRPKPLYLTNSPSPKYSIIMRDAGSPPPCAKINGDWSCVSTRYWCTDLLIDSYNIVLQKKVLGEDLGKVEKMIEFFKQNSSQGFNFIHYRNSSEHKTALIQLYNGNAAFGNPIFFESKEGQYTGNEHVGMIRNMVLNTDQSGQYTGNGYIDTYEANSWTKTGHYVIKDWNITGVPYPVTGFGTYTQPSK